VHHRPRIHATMSSHYEAPAADRDCIANAHAVFDVNVFSGDCDSSAYFYIVAYPDRSPDDTGSGSQTESRAEASRQHEAV
jgi:hypothetical protein